MQTEYKDMSRDQLLMLWEKAKADLANAKDRELDLRKACVEISFEEKKEGTNTIELGNGYELKAQIKFNYKLDPDLNKIRASYEEIKRIGNEGPFIADRIFKWSADLVLPEYRKLENPEIKKLVDRVLTITEGAPTLEIKAPKESKK